MPARTDLLTHLKSIPVIAAMGRRTLVGGRLKLALTALLLVFAGVCYVIVSNRRIPEPSATLFGWVSTAVILVGVVPLLGCYLAVQSVHGDLESKSYQYLFLRPVPRWAVLLGKWIAAWIWTAVLGMVAMTVCFGVFYGLGGGRAVDMDLGTLPWFLAAVVLDAAAFTAVGSLFAAWFRWPIVWSAVFVVLTCYLSELLAANLGMDQFGFTGPVREFLVWGLELGPDIDVVDGEARLSSISGMSIAVWPQGPRFQEWDDALIGNPVRGLFGAMAVILLVAMWRYGNAEYEQRTTD